MHLSVCSQAVYVCVVCVYVCVYMCVYMCVYVCVYMCTCTCVCVCVCVCNNFLPAIKYQCDLSWSLISAEPKEPPKYLTCVTLIHHVYSVNCVGAN